MDFHLATGDDQQRATSGDFRPAIDRTCLGQATVARREFEYKRHGTLSFMINFDVATGQVICPSNGPTRTEADFVAHVRRTVANDPTVTQWHFVLDNLDIHRSESLVR